MELFLRGDKPLASGAALLNLLSGRDTLVVDARDVSFACPLDLAGLLAIAHWASAGGMFVTLQLPREQNVASYFQRMDVLRRMPSPRRILGRVPSDERADQRHRLLEVSPLGGETGDDLAETVGRLITGFYPDKSGRAVARACNELLANAVEHGTSSKGGFIAAQTYTGDTTGDRRLELAVCDNGIGVLEHLRLNPEHQHLREDVHALRKALKEGVTGTTDPDEDARRGNGLSDLVATSRKHGALRLHMRSGKGEINLAADITATEPVVGSTTREDQTPGTWAWLTHRLPQDG